MGGCCSEGWERWGMEGEMVARSAGASGGAAGWGGAVGGRGVGVGRGGEVGRAGGSTRRRGRPWEGALGEGVAQAGRGVRMHAGEGVEGSEGGGTVWAVQVQGGHGVSALGVGARGVWDLLTRPGSHDGHYGGLRTGARVFVLCLLGNAALGTLKGFRKRHAKFRAEIGEVVSLVKEFWHRDAFRGMEESDTDSEEEEGGEEEGEDEEEEEEEEEVVNEFERLDSMRFNDALDEAVMRAKDLEVELVGGGGDDGDGGSEAGSAASTPMAGALSSAGVWGRGGGRERGSGSEAGGGGKKPWAVVRKRFEEQLEKKKKEDNRRRKIRRVANCIRGIRRLGDRHSDSLSELQKGVGGASLGALEGWEHQVVIEEAAFMMRHASAAYGWSTCNKFYFKHRNRPSGHKRTQVYGHFRMFLAVVGFVHDSVNHFRLPLTRLVDGKRCIERHTGIPRENVLHIVEEDSGLEPAHYIAVDHEVGEIILSIRGTMSFDAVLIDLMGRPTPFRSGYTHSGMLKSAQILFDRLGGVVLRHCQRLPDYSLRVVGHSLGAGVAVLWTLMFREAHPEFLNVFCFAFGVPGLFNLELARSMEHEHIYSFVVGNDMFPRLSVGSLMQMRQEIVSMNKVARRQQRNGGASRSLFPSQEGAPLASPARPDSPVTAGALGAGRDDHVREGSGLEGFPGGTPGHRRTPSLRRAPILPIVPESPAKEFGRGFSFDAQAPPQRRPSLDRTDIAVMADVEESEEGVADQSTDASGDNPAAVGGGEPFAEKPKAAPGGGGHVLSWLRVPTIWPRPQHVRAQAPAPAPAPSPQGAADAEQSAEEAAEEDDTKAFYRMIQRLDEEPVLGPGGKMIHGPKGGRHSRSNSGGGGGGGGGMRRSGSSHSLGGESSVSGAGSDITSISATTVNPSEIEALKLYPPERLILLTYENGSKLGAVDMGQKGGVKVKAHHMQPKDCGRLVIHGMMVKDHVCQSYEACLDTLLVQRSRRASMSGASEKLAENYRLSKEAAAKFAANELEVMPSKSGSSSTGWGFTKDLSQLLLRRNRAASGSTPPTTPPSTSGSSTPQRRRGEPPASA